MIVTLTPNPSIDRTITVDHLLPGEVNRARSVRIDPGGKGVNVSRALQSNGHETLAVLPLGGPDGALHDSLLEAAKLPHTAVAIAGNTRTNVAIVDPAGITTKVNEPGPALDAREAASLAAAVPPDADWVVLCGSLPRGIAPSLFTDVVASHPGRVVVDTSGPALAAAVAARPHLIKPNLEELEELVGRLLPTLGDVREASRELVARGIAVVVASLGADGALLTTAEGNWFSAAGVAEPLSTVGAGDCLLAGVLSALAEGAHPADALDRGVAWGAAAVALPGSQVPGTDDVARVEVHRANPPDQTVLT